MRRLASEPTASSDTGSGASPGHHAMTGESGRSSGSSVDDLWSASSPWNLRAMISPGTSSPMCSSASSRSARAEPSVVTMMREGCSRPASTHASKTLSYSLAGVSTSRVKTMPDAAPTLWRADMIAFWMAWAVVSFSVVIMGDSSRQGRRQVKPSRSSIVRPEGGPHVPAA